MEIINDTFYFGERKGGEVIPPILVSGQEFLDNLGYSLRDFAPLTRTPLWISLESWKKLSTTSDHIGTILDGSRLSKSALLERYREISEKYMALNSVKNIPTDLMAIHRAEVAIVALIYLRDLDGYGWYFYSADGEVYRQELSHITQERCTDPSQEEKRRALITLMQRFLKYRS